MNKRKILSVIKFDLQRFAENGTDGGTEGNADPAGNNPEGQDSDNDNGGGLDVDGLVGTKTLNALGQHTVREGETQYMVTALEVLLLMNGYNPHGVEIPGGFGAGLGRCVLQYKMDQSNLTNDRIVGRDTLLQLIK